MIERSKIEKIVDEFIRGTDIFLVAVKAGAGNRISVLADTMKGITLDECAAIHRHIEGQLDRSVEDFELQVSSPGIDIPFSVLQQYRKNEGKKVEVTDNDGTKFSGMLKNITAGGFELETEIRVKGKGRVPRDISFNFDEVKSTREVLVIK